MKTLWRVFSKHPISTLSMALLIGLWYIPISTNWKLGSDRAHLNHGEILVTGEGIAYGFIFAAFFTMLFIASMLINAIFRKQNKFYYGVILLIVVLLLLWVNIYFLLLAPFLYFVLKGPDAKSPGASPLQKDDLKP